MDFIIFFHLHHCKKDLLIENLRQCSGMAHVQRKRRPEDVQDKILADINAEPDYLVINQSAPEWHSIECNSFKKLHEWARHLSKALDTMFVQTLYCSIEEYAYLLVYERGIKRREIEGTGASPVPLVNEGSLLPFEKPGKDEDRANGLRMFDLDTLADYCHHLGIDMTCLQAKPESLVLDGGRKGQVLYNISHEMKQTLWRLEADTRLGGVRKK
jgi:hypothetical protein